MNEDKPLSSLPMELVGNASLAILCAVGAAFFGEYTDTKIASRAGLALCYMSAILAAYKIVLAPRYKARLSKVIDTGEKSAHELELKKLDVYSEEQSKKIESEYNKDLEPIYQEIQYFYSFDARAKANLILSLVFIGLGSVLQIYGAT